MIISGHSSVFVLLVIFVPFVFERPCRDDATKRLTGQSSRKSKLFVSYLFLCCFHLLSLFKLTLIFIVGGEKAVALRGHCSDSKQAEYIHIHTDPKEIPICTRIWLLKSFLSHHHSGSSCDAITVYSIKISTSPIAKVL